MCNHPGALTIGRDGCRPPTLLFNNHRMMDTERGLNFAAVRRGSSWGPNHTEYLTATVSCKLSRVPVLSFERSSFVVVAFEVDSECIKSFTRSQQLNGRKWSNSKLTRMLLNNVRCLQAYRCACRTWTEKGRGCDGPCATYWTAAVENQRLSYGEAVRFRNEATLHRHHGG